tara:strand:- start:41 stop:358 length:318 start_codon:yes stop_codon:yes gene_type:complete
MKLENYDNYVLVSIYNINDFDELVNLLEGGSLQNTNMIINFLKCDIDHNIAVNKLLPFHFIWQKRNNSFILVSKISRKITKELISIATLEEARDYFHMEQLTKNI